MLASVVDATRRMEDRLDDQQVCDFIRPFTKQTIETLNEVTAWDNALEADGQILLRQFVSRFFSI